MKRSTQEGFVVISPAGDVVGVGFDTIGATRDAMWRCGDRRVWQDMVKDGYRTCPARVTATYEPKA